MFDKFLEFFEEDVIIGNGSETGEVFSLVLGGRAFGGGIMFSVAPRDVSTWKENICIAYGAAAQTLKPFAYDWLGDCFVEDNKGGVHILELGTGEVLNTGLSVETFLAEEIPSFHDQCLLSPFWNDWLASGGMHPTYGQCIGYKVPLFLGGKDDVSNLELSDLDVYWYVISQTLAKVRR